MKQSGGHNYSCMETCGMDHHCGNRYCSAHPLHYQVVKTKSRKKRHQQTTQSYIPTQSRRSRSEPQIMGRRDDFDEERMPFYFGRQ